MPLSLIAEARDEIARQTRPRITPPDVGVVDSLRALAGPLGPTPDPLVAGYAASRASTALGPESGPRIDFSAPVDPYEPAAPIGGRPQPRPDPFEVYARTGQIEQRPGDIFNPIKAARIDIPGARSVASAAGDVAGAVVKEHPLTKRLNLAAEKLGAGDIGGKDVTPANVIATLVEAAVPVEVWQAALELIPGVGTVPDLVRLVKAGAPEAVLALRTALKDERLQPVIRKLAGERGELRLPGQGPEKPKLPGGEPAPEIFTSPERPWQEYMKQGDRWLFRTKDAGPSAPFGGRFVYEHSLDQKIKSGELPVEPAPPAAAPEPAVPAAGAPAAGEAGGAPKLTRDQMERMDVDTLDRMAFGVAGGDVIHDVPPSQIQLRYSHDVVNAEHKFEQGGMKWAQGVDLTTPIDVTVGQDGAFYIEDGHHRWFAADKSGRNLSVKVVGVRGKPIEVLLARQEQAPIPGEGVGLPRSRQSVGVNDPYARSPQPPQQATQGAGGAEPPSPPPTAVSAGDAPTGPPESAGNAYLAPLRPFGEVKGEVVTSDNPLVKTATRGINPSVRADEMGEVLTAYNRQRVSSDGLAETGVRAALDAHAQRLSGAEPVNIGTNGRVKNVTAKNGGSLNWHDVFERPDNYNLTPTQRAYIDDYHQLAVETENMRVAAGLKPRAVKRTDGSRYIPRAVDEVRGTKIRKRAKPGLTRHYTEERGGAAAGEAAGVRYKPPRATIMEHVSAAYNEIADKQLADAIEPMSITPKQLVAQSIKDRMEKAIKARRAAESDVRRLRFNVAATPDIPKSRVHYANLQKAQAALEPSRAEYQAARNSYTKALDIAKAKEVAPGALWGPNQPNEIAISTWRNRMFPREWGDQLTDTIASFGKTGDKQGWLFHGMQFLGDHIRFLSAVGDFAAPLTHGLPLLGKDLPGWVRASIRHYQAFADPAVQGRYVRDRLTTFQEMAQHGVPVGDPEFFAALREGQGLNAGQLLEAFGTKGKAARGALQQAGKQTFGRFGASYNMFLGAARAELWDSLAKAIPDMADRGRLVRNMTGGLDSRALGVGANQRGAESMWLAFSPRLLRSTTALIGMLAEPNTAVGREAWKALAGLAGGAMGLYVVSGLALGKSEEEIKTGLNPLNGKKFLSHQINGDWIGIGGQVRAITQLLAGSIADPKSLATRDRFDNPLLQFYQSRGAPSFSVTEAVVEGTTGVNADPYNEIDSIPEMFRHVGTSALPFTIQNAIERQEPLTLAAGLAGARTSPPTFSEEGREAVQSAGGDFRAAMQAAAESGNETRIKQVQSAWRKDFEKRAKPFGLTVVKGAFAEVEGAAPLSRAPLIMLDSVDALWKRYGVSYAMAYDMPAANTYTEQRKQFIEQRKAKYMAATERTEPVAYDDLAQMFDSLPISKEYKKATQGERLKFWAEHPDILYEAWQLGLEQDNADERKIIAAYEARQPVTAGR